MAKIESAFFDLSYLDTLATGRTAIHRLDPRIKVLIAALFVVCVVSFDKYAIASMFPFALFLTIIMVLGAVPVSFIMKKLALTSPFAIMIGIFNPFFDQQIHSPPRPDGGIRRVALVSFHFAAFRSDGHRHAGSDCHYRLQFCLHGLGKTGYADDLRGPVADALPLYLCADRRRTADVSRPGHPLVSERQDGDEDLLLSHRATAPAHHRSRPAYPSGHALPRFRRYYPHPAILRFTLARPSGILRLVHLLLLALRRYDIANLLGQFFMEILS